MFVTIGDEATVMCHATGKPTPHVDWYINGVPMDSEYYGVKLLV